MHLQNLRQKALAFIYGGEHVRKHMFISVPTQCVGTNFIHLNLILNYVNPMGIAPNASFVKLPIIPPPYPNILDFLVTRFPYIPSETWEKRIREKKVFDPQGLPITLESPYLPGKRLYYFREVEKEPCIPLQESILFENEHLLVVAKPHFLPVTPGGQYVNECLLYRLKNKLNLPDLVPLHRLDKDTAGIVLFSKSQTSRSEYEGLFRNEKIHKTYLAVCLYDPNHSSDIPLATPYRISYRMEPDEPRFRMKICDGIPNSLTTIVLRKIEKTYSYFALYPITGKTHQLRVHLNSQHHPILYDPYYPILRPAENDYSKPLQLLAKRISWYDPFLQKILTFTTPQRLQEWPQNLIEIE